MILVDHQIRDRLHDGLFIGDFEEEFLQPASYDLRIGQHIYAPPEPDKPYDLEARGGAYRLAPYSTVMLETYENLQLPKSLVGRIGLKSGLARLGLVASTGPQIDPGFQGKLFVSLFNLTAASHILKFKETFLTIEFETLDQEPTQGYSGPYQGKTTPSPEVLDAMVRLEGMTLSQMQQQFSSLATQFQDFLTEMRANTQAVNEMNRRLGGLVAPSPEVEPIRRLGVDQAAAEISRLFHDEKQALYYSDIAERLHLDLNTVIAAVDELQARGVVEEAAPQ